MTAEPRQPPSPDMPALSDQSLVRRIRGGNEDAALQLYLRYAQRLRALTRAQSSHELTRKEEIDDIVQSVFGSFIRGVNTGHYDVPAGEELWKLFLVIGLNKIRAKAAYHHAAKRDSRRTVGGEGLELASPAGQGDEASLRLLQMTIDETLERLAPLQRQMVRLRIEGHGLAEIARATQRTQRTVERVLQGFRQMLAEELAAEA